MPGCLRYYTDGRNSLVSHWSYTLNVFCPLKAQCRIYYCVLIVIRAHPVCSTPPSPGQLSLCSPVQPYGNVHKVRIAAPYFLRSNINKRWAYHCKNRVIEWEQRWLVETLVLWTQIRLDSETCYKGYLYYGTTCPCDLLFIHTPEVFTGRLFCLCIHRISTYQMFHFLLKRHSHLFDFTQCNWKTKQ